MLFFLLLDYMLQNETITMQLNDPLQTDLVMNLKI